MKRHTKIYMDYFGYYESSFIPCEICGNKANDIHHIKARGMGGDPKGSKDNPSNLMALCRNCHVKYGDVPDLIEKIQEIHLKRMENK